MPSTLELGQLTEEEWSQLQSQATRLEEAWKHRDSVNLEEFLPSRNDHRRLVHLRELVKTELEIRYRRGQRVTLEYYTSQFPELGQARDLPVSLIYEEYRLRRLYGEKPTLVEYQKRFPQRAQELQERFREHESQASLQPPHAFGSEESNFSSADKVFRKIRVLASGAFADVWLGEAPGELPVAIKVIRQSTDQSAGRRENEALERTKGLKNPFLVQTHAHWTDQEGRLHIVMELGDKTLLQRLNECKSADKPGIPPEELIKYFRGVADALDYLHRQDLHHKPMVHQDVKPANILLIHEHAKLADFGLAEILPDVMKTIAGQGDGTPTYMAPDAYKREVHPHNDQYSLAATYVHLRLGRPLFPDLTYFGQMQAHLNTTPILDPLPEAEQRVLLKALAKDRKQRHGSCVEFITALEEALSPSARRGDKLNKPILDHRIGKAGRGDIHEGLLPDGTMAAITVIHDLSPSEFRQQVRALKLLKTIDHEHLAKVYACWQLDRNGAPVAEDANDSCILAGKVSLYVATELFRETLEQRLEKSMKANRRGLEAKEVVSYLKQAATALDFLNHRRPYPGGEELAIQHCGLGPHCFYVNGHTLKLGDYSLVKVLSGDSASLRDNSNLEPGWAAPEVFQKSVVVRQSDQYRLAVSYYQLRTGKLPFDKATPHKVMEEGLDLTGLDDAERKVIAQATAVRPGDRFPTSIALMKALERACSARTSQAKPPPAPIPEVPKPQRNVERVPEAPTPQVPEAPTRSGYSEWRTDAPSPQEASPQPAMHDLVSDGDSLRPGRDGAGNERALSSEPAVDKAPPSPSPHEEAEDFGQGLQESVWLQTKPASELDTFRREPVKPVPEPAIEQAPPLKESLPREEEQEHKGDWRDEAVVEVKRKHSFRFPRPGKRLLGAVALVLVVAMPVIFWAIIIPPFTPPSAFSLVLALLENKKISEAIDELKKFPETDDLPTKDVNRLKEILGGYLKRDLPKTAPAEIPDLKTFCGLLPDRLPKLVNADQQLNDLINRIEKLVPVGDSSDAAGLKEETAALKVADNPAACTDEDQAKAAQLLHTLLSQGSMQHPAKELFLALARLAGGDRNRVQLCLKALRSMPKWVEDKNGRKEINDRISELVVQQIRRSVRDLPIEELVVILGDALQLEPDSPVRKEITNVSLTHAKTALRDRALQLALKVLEYEKDSEDANKLKEELQALKVAGTGDAQPAERAAAAETFNQRLRTHQSQRSQAELSLGFADLAEKDRKPNLETAVDTLKSVRKHIPEGAERNEVTKRYVKLFTLQMQQRIGGLKTKRDFEDIFGKCDEAVKLDPQPNGYLLALRAESGMRIERNLPADVFDSVLRPGAVRDAGLYGEHVQALIWDEKRNDLEKAIAALDRAFFAKDGQGEIDWKNSDRKDRAADIYCRAAQQRQNADPAQAFTWYDRAVVLHDNPPPEYRFGLAKAWLRAGAKRSPTHNQRAKEETSKLLANQSFKNSANEEFEVRLIHAEAKKQLGEVRGAVNDYLKMLELADVPAQNKYDGALVQARNLGTKWLKEKPDDPERAEVAASVFAAMGQFILNNEFEKFPLPQKDRIDTARTAYENARTLYRGKDKKVAAEYAMWYGYLLTQGRRVDLETVKQLLKIADDAAAADFSGSQFIRGLAFVYRAELPETIANDDLVREYEFEAISALTTAIERGEKEKPALLDLYYVARSNANVVMGNYIYRQDPRRKKEYQRCFEQARSDAEAVVKPRLDHKPHYPWHAYLLLGNALEDLAWLCGQGKLYEKAIEAFNDSDSVRPFNAAVFTARGRTYYKRGDAVDLPAAEEALVEACRLAELESEKDTALLGEARLWLGQVYLRRGKYEEASRSISEALKVASPAWLKFAVDEIIPKELSAAVALKSLEGATQLARTARAQCQKLHGTNLALRCAATRMIVKSWLVEGDLLQASNKEDRAREAYEHAWQAYGGDLNDQKLPDLERFYLLIERSDVVVDVPTLNSDPGKLKQSIADAERALDLAKQKDLPKSDQAYASYQAGKAWYIKALKPKSVFTDFETAKDKFIAALDLKLPDRLTGICHYYAGVSFYGCWLKSANSPRQESLHLLQQAEHHFAIAGDDKLTPSGKKPEINKYLAQVRQRIAKDSR